MRTKKMTKSQKAYFHKECEKMLEDLKYLFNDMENKNDAQTAALNLMIIRLKIRDMVHEYLDPSTKSENFSKILSMKIVTTTKEENLKRLKEYDSSKDPSYWDEPQWFRYAW